MLTAHHSRTLAIVLVLVLLSAGCLGVITDEPSQDELRTHLTQGPAVETVVGKYTVTETVGNETTHASVRVWNTKSQSRQTITASNQSKRIVIANESRTWIYFPESGEAYRRGFTVLDQTGIQPYSYAALISNLHAYRIDFRGTETIANRSTYHVELVLAPDGGPLPEIEFYTYHIGGTPTNVTVRPTHVELWLDTEHWYPLKHELRVEDERGTDFVTTIEYDTVTFNRSITPSRFRFKPESRPNVEVVMDDIATTYRPFEAVTRAEARAGIVYDVPSTIDQYQLERIAVVQSAEGRGIKGLYMPADSAANNTETRITKPTHPNAVTVVVSPDGTYRDLTGFPRLDGDTRTIGGHQVEFKRLSGHWTEVTFTCDGTRYTVTGNANVSRETIRTVVDATGCS